MAVAKRNGKALKFMLPIFRADPEVVRAAVSRDPQAAQFAHASRRAELGMIQESIHGEVQLKEELDSHLPPSVSLPPPKKKKRERLRGSQPFLFFLSHLTH